MKSFINKRGLAFKMIVFIFSAAAVLFLTLVIYNYRVSRNLIEKNIRENAEKQTWLTVSKIENVLMSIQKIPYNLSKILENSPYEAEDIKTFLRLVIENNPEISGITFAFEPYMGDPNIKHFAPYYFREKGKISFSYLGGKDEGKPYNYFLWDWYQIPKELGKPVWSEPYYEPGGGNMIMTSYSVPVFRTINGKKRFLGILTADISLEWLRNIVSSVKIYQTGYAFLISRTGSFITHPVKQLVMNETMFSIAEERNYPQLRDIGRSMLRGEKSFAQIEYRNATTGKLSWIAYAPISMNGWSLGIVYPVDEFMADINHLYSRILIIGIAGLFILLAIIIIISRSITKPVRNLSLAASQIAEGNYKTAIPIISSGDEIGKLSSSFLYMQTTLNETIDNLITTSEELKVSNEKLEEYSRTLENKVEERTVELKEKNRALDTAFQNVKVLSELGRKITMTLDFESILEQVYQFVNSLLDAASFLIYVYKKDGDELECKLSMERSVRLPAFTIPMSDKDRFVVWCVENRSPIFINDVDTEYTKYISKRSAPKAGERVASLLYIPMLVGDKLIGAISAQSFKRNAYSQYHFDILNNLASYVAIALDNASAYEKIKEANRELQETQSQLIQAEKMASLGQLTAGIAHEIKNPLNFVNNFAELSLDLVNELSEEVIKHKDILEPNTLEYIQDILNDLRHNSVKINEHGKRADNIVKGMLLHSRGKSGEKQKTDINSLLAEYVNLAYHGMRAQDSSFNIKIETSFDNTIQPIDVVPQDLSRVFLNIINNACYSTNEKKKEKGASFNPLLRVSSKKIEDRIEIRIWDNGKGIPAEIVDKIFNPFFTTKPTGKGTGLGLSLSYDIIVQEHNGSITVNSEVDKYAEFILTIPANNSRRI